jgi:hypothetical protein
MLFTFNGQMGKSVPDYILSPSHCSTPLFTILKCTNQFHAAPTICGSDHRLLTATLTNSSHNLSSIWGSPPLSYIEWSKEHIDTYTDTTQKELSKIPLNVPKTKQEITHLGRLTTEALTHSLTLISTDKSNQNRSSKHIKHIYEADRTYIKATKEQAHLLNTILPRLSTKRDTHQRRRA